MKSPSLSGQQMRAYVAFVDAQQIHGAQSQEALAALRTFRKAIGAHREPPPGMVETR